MSRFAFWLGIKTARQKMRVFAVFRRLPRRAPLRDRGYCRVARPRGLRLKMTRVGQEKAIAGKHRTRNVFCLFARKKHTHGKMTCFSYIPLSLFIPCLIYFYGIYAGVAPGIRLPALQKKLAVVFLSDYKQTYFKHKSRNSCPDRRKKKEYCPISTWFHCFVVI